MYSCKEGVDASSFGIVLLDDFDKISASSYGFHNSYFFPIVCGANDDCWRFVVRSSGLGEGLFHFFFFDCQVLINMINYLVDPLLEI